ncbi:MAG: Flp family type IVb pilin [Pseudomonadota bacterium]
MGLIKSLIENEDGATAVEYGLIAALVSVAIITVLQSLGANLAETFTTVSNGLDLTIEG